MLGLIPLYFIGKWYSELAFEHDRKRWVYAIIGILSYFAGSLIYALILGIILAASGRADLLQEKNEIWINLSAIPFGVGTTVALYYSMRRYLRKNPKDSETSDLLDSSTINSNSGEI